MSSRVVITGAGLLCALADDLGGFHAALAAGTSGLRRVENVSTEGLGAVVAGELAAFDAAVYLGDGNLRPLDRTSRLAASAAKLALADAGLDEARDAEWKDAAGLALGTMFGSVRTIAEFDRRALTAGPNYVSPLDFANSVINAAAGHAAIWLGLRGVNATLTGGSSAGAQALGYAFDQLRSGRVDLMLAGGADELSFESLVGFSLARVMSLTPRPLARDRDGMALGEGAALLVLERAGPAAARGARLRAEIVGYGSAFGPGRGGEVALAAALANATRLALDQAGMAADEVDLVSCGAAGDPLLDAAEARALAQVFGRRTGGLPILAIKGLTGECLGAAAPLQALALLAAMERGEVAGLPWAGSLDDDLGFEVGEAPRQQDVRHGVVTALDADGQAAALVVSRMDPAP